MKADSFSNSKVATAAVAQDPLPKVTFGEPGYGGSGCPDGTAKVIRGFSNQAAHYGLIHTGHLPMERVIADPPRVMLAPEGAGHDSDSRAAILRKRAIAETGLKVTQAQFARQLVNCGGPVIPAALARLAEIRRQVR